MSDEIKEILDYFKRSNKNKLGFEQDKIITYKEANQLLNYITNLQEELKEYKMLFDAFSKRPYAHRYLEEKKKELGNNKIIGLDSEMIYKDYYDLKQENERLKVKYDNSKSHQINYNYFKTLYEKATKDIVIDDLVYKCEDLDNLRQSYEKLYVEKEVYKSRNKKAIEYIKSYKNDYAPYELSDYNIRELLNILNGGDEEC